LLFLGFCSGKKNISRDNSSLFLLDFFRIPVPIFFKLQQIAIFFCKTNKIIETSSSGCCEIPRIEGKFSRENCRFDFLVHVYFWFVRRTYQKRFCSNFETLFFPFPVISSEFLQDFYFFGESYGKVFLIKFCLHHVFYPTFALHDFKFCELKSGTIIFHTKRIL
jgi:hypothetical protein